MRYEKQTVLTHDENPFGGKDYDADVPFMVGDLKVLSWKEEDSRGVESHSVRPAYSASPDFAESAGRCWYHVWSYEATERGNHSRGYGAELMPFLEGVAKLVERDVFAFPLPKDGPFISIDTDGDPVALAWSKARAGELSVGVAPVAVVQLDPGQELRFPASPDVRPVAYTHDDLVDGALGLKRLDPVRSA